MDRPAGGTAGQEPAPLQDKQWPGALTAGPWPHLQTVFCPVGGILWTTLSQVSRAGQTAESWGGQPPGTSQSQPAADTGVLVCCRVLMETPLLPACCLSVRGLGCPRTRVGKNTAGAMGRNGLCTLHVWGQICLRTCFQTHYSCQHPKCASGRPGYQRAGQRQVLTLLTEAKASNQAGQASCPRGVQPRAGGAEPPGMRGHCGCAGAPDPLLGGPAPTNRPFLPRKPPAVPSTALSLPRVVTSTGQAGFLWPLCVP